MIVERIFYNIQCSCCWQMLDDETWWDEKEPLEGILGECNWKNLGGRHYCDECWRTDDDDNIVTEDGMKFTQDGERIRDGICVNELGDETRHQVLAILAVEKMKRWFEGLPYGEKMKFAEEYPEFVTRTPEQIRED